MLGDLGDTVVDHSPEKTQKEIVVAATLELQKPPTRKQASLRRPKAEQIADDPIASATAADEVLSAGSTLDVESPIAEPAAEHSAVELRHEAIARAAYFLAEARGFEHGRELEDWLAAERLTDVP
jgi:hypothetical protein